METLKRRRRKKWRESDLLKRLEAGRLPVVWAKGEVLYDRPGRVTSPEALHASNSMSPRLREIIQEGQKRGAPDFALFCAP